MFVSAEEIVRQRCYELGPNCKGYQKKQGYAGTFYSYSTDSSDPGVTADWSYEELDVNAKNILKIFSNTLPDAKRIMEHSSIFVIHMEPAHKVMFMKVMEIGCNDRNILC